MCLLLDKLKQIELAPESEVNNYIRDEATSSEFDFSLKTTEFHFPDLGHIPPELSLQILKNLNATDLCLAACVWQSLANDDILWHSLCRSTWGHASIYYNRGKQEGDGFRHIFMHLDEATLAFNADWKKGLEYLFQKNLVDNDPMEIAKFVNATSKLSPRQKEKLFKEK